MTDDYTILTPLPGCVTCVDDVSSAGCNDVDSLADVVDEVVVTVVVSRSAVQFKNINTKYLGLLVVKVLID